MTDDRRRAVALPVSVLVAVAVVVLAARGDHADRTVAAFDVPEDAAGTVVAALFAALALVALTVLLVARPPVGARRRAPRRTWRDLVVALALAAIGIALASNLQPDRRERADREESGSAAATTAPTPAERASGDRASPTASLAVAALAVAVLTAVGAVAVGRREHGAASDSADVDMTEAETVSMPAPDDAVALAHREAEPRRAVLLAFAAAEALLAATPSRRRPSQAPREWLASVTDPDVGGPLGRLVRAYELARFSHHTIGANDRDVALRALDDLADIARAQEAASR